MAGHHHGGPRLQRHFNARHTGAHAGVLGDLPGIVLRHIQVGAYEYPLACNSPLVTQILKAFELHDASSKIKLIRLATSGGDVE